MNKKLQKAQLDAALVTALVQESHKSYLQLAREFGVSINYVTGIVQRNNLTRKRGRGSPAWPGKPGPKTEAV
jgi:hypothetical protein